MHQFVVVAVVSVLVSIMFVLIGVADAVGTITKNQHLRRVASDPVDAPGPFELVLSSSRRNSVIINNNNNNGFTVRFCI